MKHVSAIKKMVETGQRDNAHDAIDNLLSLGPNNIEALKLKALLYESEGNFKEETATWRKILLIDDEDPDAMAYVGKKHLEAQELFYFTDELPNGRKFFIYPKSLITAAIVGLLGCVCFLIFSKYWQGKDPAQTTTIIVGAFIILVALPWVGIILNYFKEIRYLAVTSEGIHTYTYFKQIVYKWGDIKEICFAHNLSLSEPELTLVLYYYDNDKKPVIFDLSNGSSPIRAKSYFMREITELGRNVSFKHISDLNLGDNLIKIL